MYNAIVDPGDIIFNYKDGCIGCAISYFQGGGCPWVHCGICLEVDGQLWMFESTRPRVRIVHLETVVKQRRVGVRRWVNAGLTVMPDDMNGRLLSVCLPLVGHDYPESKIIDMMWRMATHRRPKGFNEGKGVVDMQDDRFCSATICAAWDNAFQCDLDTDHKHDFTTPRDLWESNALVTITENLVEK